MSPHSHRSMLLSLALTVAVMGGCFGFAVGRASAPGIKESDLIPAGVNNCVTAIVGRLDLLNPNQIDQFTDAEIAELRLLPERCEEPDVAAGLEAEYPALLSRL